jgi:hypothetical protein
MIEAILSVILSVTAMAIVAALVVWIMKACDPCTHSYERIDNCNDKKMVLVCRHCGKIKKLRK